MKERIQVDGQAIEDAIKFVLDHVEQRLADDKTVSGLEVMTSVQTFAIALTDITYKASARMANVENPMEVTANLMVQVFENALDMVDARYYPEGQEEEQDPSEKAVSSTSYIKPNTNPMPDEASLIAGFEAYQARSIGTISYPSDMAIWYPTLGLGEAGEVQNKVKKVFRDDGGVLTPERRDAIKKEMGGVIWYLAALAHGMGESLGEIAMDNLKELAGRQERGTLHGDGDNR